MDVLLVSDRFFGSDPLLSDIGMIRHDCLVGPCARWWCRWGDHVGLSNFFMKWFTWVISHVPIFHITQPLGIWSTRWLLEGDVQYSQNGTFTNPWFSLSNSSDSFKHMTCLLVSFFASHVWFIIYQHILSYGCFNPFASWVNLHFWCLVRILEGASQLSSG